MIDEFVREWVAKALGDLKVAEHELMLPPEEAVAWAICFHCQQAAEKLLKAFLVSNQIDFKKTHDLDYLRQLCTEIDPDFENVDIGDLTSYAAEARYPSASYAVSMSDARECFRIASNIKSFVLKKLKVDEKLLR